MGASGGLGLIVILLLGAPEHADNPSLVQARQHYVDLRFDKAAIHLDKALRFANRHNDLVEIYELQGLAWAALGKRRKAREAFARLLMIAPEHQLPDHMAPRMTRSLNQARNKYAAGGWLSASAKGPATVHPGDPITVEAWLENDPFGMADQFRISYRIAGSAHVESRAVRAGRLARVNLDVDLEGRAERGRVEYWVTVLDSFGGELFFVGSPESPLAVAWEPHSELVPAPALTRVDDPRALEPPPPFYETWWFWTAVGAVVVGTAAGVAVAVLPEDPGCPPGTICAGQRIGGAP